VVLVRRFHDAGLGGLADDVANACGLFSGTKREKEARALRRLWIETFESDVAAWSDARAERSFGAPAVWRHEGAYKILRTPDLPTLAFTLATEAGRTVVVLLGGCCDFSGSEEDWWTNVIRPRVLAL